MLFKCTINESEGDTMGKRPSQKAVAAGCISFAPNDALAQAIVKAWTDQRYRDDLLTFGDKDNWNKMSPAARAAKIRKTSEALEKVDVFLDSPVVLTAKQFAIYKSSSKDEVVFVLPEPLSTKPTLATAKVAMAVTCRGV
jgi:hypothetical protein